MSVPMGAESQNSIVESPGMARKNTAGPKKITGKELPSDFHIYSEVDAMY